MMFRIAKSPLSSRLEEQLYFITFRIAEYSGNGRGGDEIKAVKPDSVENFASGRILMGKSE